MKIPEKTIESIYSWRKAKGDAEPPRLYLGGSQIGHHCARELWYQFRGCIREDFPGRMYRLFDRGHREEPVFFEELRGIGCEIMEGPAPGKQFRVAIMGGHIAGHCDGVIRGIPDDPETWHLLELKTASEKNFKKMVREGVHNANRVHFSQMQFYMQHLRLRKALYLVVNKNTDEIHGEIIEYNKRWADALVERARMIVTSPTPPPPVADRPDHYLCRFLSGNALTFGLAEVMVPVPKLDWRQSIYASANTETGKWELKLPDADPYGEPDDRHIFLPGLIYGSEAIDKGENPDGTDFIVFKKSDGTTWKHGPNRADGQYTSRDLISLPKELVGFFWSGDHPIQNRKHKNLLGAYSTDNCERVWSGRYDSIEEEAKKIAGQLLQAASSLSWQAAEFKHLTDETSTVLAVIWTDKSAEIRLKKRQKT